MNLLPLVAVHAVALGVVPGGEELTHPYDLQHIAWSLSFDEQRQTIQGDVTNVIALVGEPVKEVFLHCARLSVSEVTVEGKEAAFRLSGDKLWITLPKKTPVGKSISIRTIYTGKPVNGFYFVNAESAFPANTGMVYTQGEPEDTRFWLPTYDEPDDFATSESYVEVPEAYTALSNGRLLGVEKKGGRKRYHWRMDQPHATYLNSLVAGEYDEFKQKFKDKDVTMRYLVPPGLGREGEVSFGRTPEMMRFVSKLLGTPYPFDDFTQVAVGDFVVGGMENATAVTMTIRTLHPAEAEPVESSEDLVVHELSHMWVGNMVSAKSWDHLWLNEGFASFIPHFWLRDQHGEEEYDLHRYATMTSAVASFRGQRLAVDLPPGPKSIPLAVGSPYAGGAARLCMLMDQIGERAFWKGVQKFLADHRFQPVTTEQFFASMSKAAGTDLTPFMRQWLYTAAIPKIEVHRDGSELVLTQSGPAFELTLPIWLLKGGKWIKLKVPLTGSGARLPLTEGAGNSVIVDPEKRLVADIYVDIPVTSAEAANMYRQAKSASMRAHIVDLWGAAMEEGDLLGLLLQERQPLLAARLLSRIKPTAAASDTIAPLMGAEDKRLVYQVAGALGRMPPTKASIEKLVVALSTDPNVVVRQAALGALLDVSGNLEIANEAWEQDSFADSYRIRVMSFWARRTPNIAREKALEALEKPISEPLRAICIEALGIVKDKPGERRAYDKLCEMLKLRAYRARLSAIRSLAVYGDPAAIPLISPLLEQRYLAPAAEDAITQLRKASLVKRGG
jgi:aminopeptidase N